MATTEAAGQKAPTAGKPRGTAGLGDFSRAILLGLAYVVISYLAAGLGGSAVAGNDTAWPAFWFLQILIYAALSVIIVLFSQMIDDRATDTGLGGPAVFLMSLGTLVSFAAFVINEFKQVTSGADHNIVREDYAAFLGAPSEDPFAYLIFCSVMMAVYALAAAIVVWSLLTSREQGWLRKMMSFFRKVSTGDQQTQVNQHIDVRVRELTRLLGVRDRILSVQADLAGETTRRGWLVRQSGEFHTLRLHTDFKAGQIEDAPDADTAALARPHYAAALAAVDAGVAQLQQAATASTARVEYLTQDIANLFTEAGFDAVGPLQARITELESETHSLRSQLSGAQAVDGLLSLADTPESDHIHGVTRLLGIGMFVTVLLMTLNNYLLAPELTDEIQLDPWTVLALLGLFVLQAVAAYYGLTSARMYLIKRQIAQRARQVPPGPTLAQRAAALVLLALLGLLIYTLMRLSEPSVARPLKAVDLTCRAFDDAAGYQTPQGVWVYNSAVNLEADSCRLAKPLDHQSYVVVVGAASPEGDPTEQFELARSRAHIVARQLRAGTDPKQVSVFVVNLGRANPVEIPADATPEVKQAATRIWRPLLVLAGNLEPEKPTVSQRLQAVFVRKPAVLPQAGEVRPVVRGVLGKTQRLELSGYDPAQCRIYRYDGEGAPVQELSCQ
ncbi:putative membrane protein [Asticcacaulis biprosthecium C19]|uniref:Putative membrane protein n=1 Tax=Asticcacaulis biprosthecium C19 TaxID=715226 RepID=F4QKT4_9CAUL|nr:hypothetical protein [Asticcacaulis biprosthecium]EGF93386.1 putative membrane protein [Asticcacaulis biprosthecium C19]